MLAQVISNNNNSLWHKGEVRSCNVVAGKYITWSVQVGCIPKLGRQAVCMIDCYTGTAVAEP